MVKNKQSGLLATKGGFEEDAGGGMEETTVDSFSIPFLQVLQKGSPQVDEASGSQIKGAKAGMIFETVGKQLLDGNKGIELVQAHFKRQYLRWGPRDSGGGFKGEIPADTFEGMRGDGRIKEVKNRFYIAGKDGEVDEDSDRVVDTRVHYVLIVDRKKGTFKRCVLSLSSTQIRKSRDLMSQFSELRLPRANGKGEYQPPTYQSIIRMKTVPEKNDQGTWYGVDFEILGQFDDANDQIYRAAKAFKESVISGAAEAKHAGDEVE